MPAPERQALRWGLVSGGALAIVAALAAALTHGARAPEPIRITLAEVRIPALRLVSVAQWRGLFAEEGLETVRKAYPSGRDALAALIAGEVDVAPVFETPAAGRAFDTPSLRILTTLHWSQRNTRLVARADRGIAAAEQLRGRRVAVPRGTNAELFLDATLESVGLRPDDVVRHYLPPADTERALRAGEVDAVAVWLPHAPPGGDLVEIPSHAYTEISMLVTRDDVVATNGEALRRVVRALARAEALLRENPDSALADLRRDLPGVSDEELRDGCARTVAQVGLSHLLLRSLDQAAEWHRARRDDGRPPPDFQRLLEPRFLLAVDPETVTLLELGER